MYSRKDVLKTTLEQALRELGQRKGEDFAAQIRPVVLANLKEGRLEFFLENAGGATPRDFVERVAGIFTSLNPFITALQIERSADVWEPLYAQMQKLAYNFLLKRGLIPGEATYRLAVDSATDAALALLNARFPYDTDFEPWAYQFIRYACLKSISREMRQARIIRAALNSAEADSLLFQANDGQNEWGLYLDLSHALQKLTPSRQQVLKLRYGQGLSSRTTAQQMGKSVNAVDKLHHDAINQLRRLLKDSAA